MKIFALRDERIISDILVRYLIAPDEDWAREAFVSTTQYCQGKGIDNISEIARTLISTHGFKPFKADVTFKLTGEHPDEEKYWQALKDLGFVEEGGNQ